MTTPILFSNESNQLYLVYFISTIQGLIVVMMFIILWLLYLQNKRMNQMERRIEAIINK